MRIQLEVAELVNSVFINVQESMAAGAGQMYIDILFTNCKLLSVHSESVPRSRSKANTFSYAKKGHVS